MRRACSCSEGSGCAICSVSFVCWGCGFEMQSGASLAGARPCISGLGGCIAHLAENDKVPECRDGSRRRSLAGRDLQSEADSRERPGDNVAGYDVEHAVIVALAYLCMVGHYATSAFSQYLRQS